MVSASNSQIPFGAKVAGAVVLLIVGIVLVLWLSPFTTVKGGHKGVVLRGEKLVRVVDDGYQYKTPALERVVEVDTRRQTETAEASAASKDLQTVTAKVSVNFSLKSDKVAEMWNNVGVEYKSIIIDPAIQEAVKSATAKHTAEELITKRETLKEEITQALRTRLNESGFLILHEVSITDFNFSNSFNASIEAKVTAEQDALASKNKLEQVKYEAQQQIEKAKAQAETIRIQAQAITQQGGKDYVQLKAIERWNGQLPTSMIPGSTVPFLDLNK